MWMTCGSKREVVSAKDPPEKEEMSVTTSTLVLRQVPYLSLFSQVCMVTSIERSVLAELSLLELQKKKDTSKQVV